MTSPPSAIVALILTGVVCLLVAWLLVCQFRTNRLLFWCLFVATLVHVAGFGYYGWRASHQPPQTRIEKVKISFIRPAPIPTPPPKPAPKIVPIPRPKPKPKPVMAPPKGRPEPSKAKIMPKGHTLDKPKVGKPQPKPKAPAPVPHTKRPDHKLTSPGGKGAPIASSTGKTGPDEPQMPGIDDDLSSHDINTDKFTAGAFKGTKTGDGAGDPNGQGQGQIPQGFKDGKINGRVYYIRLKHGGGAWNAYNSGTSNLLAFLNKDFKAESESRAMTAVELRDKYMRNGAQPTFLYIYCDDSFHFNSTEVTVLRQYMDNGGFLFLDSVPNDATIHDKVASELSKILPGSRLAPVSRSNPINSALYKLNQPGIGENFVEQKNYGVSKGGHIVAFYSPGNFSHFYSMTTPSQSEYAKAQYQMGANIIVYAMHHGDVSSLGKRKGADATVSAAALQKLGFLDAPTPPPVAKPTESVKIKPPPGQKGPEDIKIE